MPQLGQRLGGLLDLLARQAVDDAGLAAMRGEEIAAAAARRCPSAPRCSGCWGGRSELTNRRASSSCRRSAISRCVGGSAVAVSAMRGTCGQRSCRIGELAVFAAEVVAPLRDAMRLVDGEQGDRACVRAATGSAASAGARARRTAGRARRRATPARPARWSRPSSVELRKAARTPSWRSASTWSCISAISGETTMPVPSRSSAGTW